jgi:hypothetical protein
MFIYSRATKDAERKLDDRSQYLTAFASSNLCVLLNSTCLMTQLFTILTLFFSAAVPVQQYGLW